MPLTAESAISFARAGAGIGHARLAQPVKRGGVVRVRCDCTSTSPSHRNPNAVSVSRIDRAYSAGQRVSMSSMHPPASTRVARADSWPKRPPATQNGQPVGRGQNGPTGGERSLFWRMQQCVELQVLLFQGVIPKMQVSINLQEHEHDGVAQECRTRGYADHGWLKSFHSFHLRTITHRRHMVLAAARDQRRPRGTRHVAWYSRPQRHGNHQLRAGGRARTKTET